MYPIPQVFGMLCFHFLLYLINGRNKLHRAIGISLCLCLFPLRMFNMCFQVKGHNLFSGWITHNLFSSVSWGHWATAVLGMPAFFAFQRPGVDSRTDLYLHNSFFDAIALPCLKNLPWEHVSSILSPVPLFFKASSFSLFRSFCFFWVICQPCSVPFPGHGDARSLTFCIR